VQSELPRGYSGAADIVLEKVARVALAFFFKDLPGDDLATEYVGEPDQLEQDEATEEMAE